MAYTRHALNLTLCFALRHESQKKHVGICTERTELATFSCTLTSSSGETLQSALKISSAVEYPE